MQVDGAALLGESETVTIRFLKGLRLWLLQEMSPHLSVGAWIQRPSSKNPHGGPVMSRP